MDIRTPHDLVEYFLYFSPMYKPVAAVPNDMIPIDLETMQLRNVFKISALDLIPTGAVLSGNMSVEYREAKPMTHDPNLLHLNCSYDAIVNGFLANQEYFKLLNDKVRMEFRFQNSIQELRGEQVLKKRYVWFQWGTVCIYWLEFTPAGVIICTQLSHTGASLLTQRNTMNMRWPTFDACSKTYTSSSVAMTFSGRGTISKVTTSSFLKTIRIMWTWQSCPVAITW